MLQRKIYVIGAQSTGKTTLVDALERSFTGDSKPFVVREVARTVMRERSYTRDDMDIPARALELQRHILESQLLAEQAAGESESSWLICDRSGLDPIAYASMCVGEGMAEELTGTETWRKLEASMKKGLVVLCEAGCEWLEDDGTRWMPETLKRWMQLDGIFRKLLEEREIPYVVCGRDVRGLADRVDLVKRNLATLNGIQPQR